MVWQRKSYVRCAPLKSWVKAGTQEFGLQAQIEHIWPILACTETITLAKYVFGGSGWA